MADEQQKLSLESFTIKDHSHDLKIDALNIFATIKIHDYLEIANTIKNNNDLQRRRVSNPSTVYALLKEDLRNGCLIPSIVLALDENQVKKIDYSNINYEDIASQIREQAENLKILDGLQRTNILIDLESELKNTNQKDEVQLKNDKRLLDELNERKIRVEVYLNVTRFGILYRMLTLNTGQTPMSLRHQIEILYSDYYIEQHEGIILLRDAFDGKSIPKFGQYKFSDVVEGVTSFIDGSEYPLDRFDLLDYIKSLKKLSNENKRIDIFTSFVTTYHILLQEFIAKSANWKFDFSNLSEENLSYFPVQRIDKETGKEHRGTPFGITAEDIFIKSQVFTGFGAAISYLKLKQTLSEINDLKPEIPNIKFQDTAKEGLDNMIVRLEQIRKDSKKIGESQRTFFKFFFISLFNKHDDDSYLIIDKAIESAFRKTT